MYIFELSIFEKVSFTMIRTFVKQFELLQN